MFNFLKRLYWQEIDRLPKWVKLPKDITKHYDRVFYIKGKTWIYKYTCETTGHQGHTYRRYYRKLR
jgi:hypothetical protein